MIGCASHRFNLAVRTILMNYQEEMDVVNKLIVKLSTLRQSTKLRLKASLRPVFGNVTRCSSSLTKLGQFFQLEPFMDMEDTEILALLPSPRARNSLQAFLKDLLSFDSVTKCNVRNFHGRMLEYFSTVCLHHLAPNNIRGLVKQWNSSSKELFVALIMELL